VGHALVLAFVGSEAPPGLVPADFRPLRVGFAHLPQELETVLKGLPMMTVEVFEEGRTYDGIVGTGGTEEASKNLPVDAEGRVQALLRAHQGVHAFGGGPRCSALRYTIIRHNSLGRAVYRSGEATRDNGSL
jgi:hypothetical protein